MTSSSSLNKEVAEIKRIIEFDPKSAVSDKWLNEKYGTVYKLVKVEFQKKYGVSVAQYSQKAKMEKAKELLDEMSHKEVAEVVGLNSAYFTIAYKKHFGYLPSQKSASSKRKRFVSGRETLVERVKAYVIEHINDNPSFTKVAPLFKISKADLKELFIEQTGTSLSEFIAIQKLEKAKALLLKGTKVKEVAKMMKYSSIPSFCIYFKNETGFSPSDYYSKMLGGSIRTKVHGEVNNEVVDKMELFIQGNLKDLDIENTIKAHFNLPIYLINKGFVNYRQVEFSSFILNKRLDAGMKMLIDKISIDVVVKLVGFNSGKEFLLNLLENEKMSISSLAKVVELERYFLSARGFKDIIKKYCHDNLNSFPKDEILSSFLNISIREFRILKMSYLEKSLAEYIEVLKMEKAKEFLREGILAKSISIRLGYTHSNALSEMFKRHFGCTIRVFQRNLEERPIRKRNIDDKLLEEVVAVIEKWYLKNNVKDILRRTYLNKYRKVCFKFRQHFGKTIDQSISEQKLVKAKELLQGGASAGEVAVTVGFANASNFSTAFKKYFGETPLSIKPVKEVGRKPKDPKLIVEKFKAYVKKHIDEPLSFSRIAEILGVAKENLKKMFSEVHQKNIQEYIEEERVERAKFLMRHGHKIIEVSRIMNYSDGTSFAAFFKAGAGMTATEYLSSIRKSQK